MIKTQLRKAYQVAVDNAFAACMQRVRKALCIDAHFSSFLLSNFLLFIILVWAVFPEAYPLVPTCNTDACESILVYSRKESIPAQLSLHILLAARSRSGN